MKEEITLAAKVRTETGSSAMNRLRKEGVVPGVIYGGDATKNVAFNAATFATLQRHHTSENVVLDLDVEGDRVHKVLIREVQHHTLTGNVLHVDFYELSMTKKVRVAIPLEFVGEPIGVSRDGGVLEHLVREIEVDCLPNDIVEQLDLDVSGMVVGDRLTAGDIPLDKAKYTLVTAADIAVASVMAARVEEETEAAVAEGGGEPEVIGKKPTEDEEDKKAE